MIRAMLAVSVNGTGAWHRSDSMLQGLGTKYEMTMWLRVGSLLAVFCFLLSVSAQSADVELQVVKTSSEELPPGKWLDAHLRAQAEVALRMRSQVFEAIKSREEAEAYQQRLRAFLGAQLGELPERTPLDAQVVGRLMGERHRVEKVIFSSQPGHHVTGVLYLPTTAPPYPCVLVSSGHSRTAKSADYNQRFGIIMARHGMAAFCFDPIGQGERSQILDERRQPLHAGTTTEHFLVGVGSILVGRNTATYRIWDAMRAIDYVSSRADIRADRIGFTGCSGGGTLTSYLMALDQRVRCAAPSCYLTTFSRLLQTIGPQDAEQNLFGQLAGGLDQPDYVMLHAPQPTLISATQDDFFPIDGTWDNFRQAKRFYHRLGHAERVDLVEGDGGHGVPMNNLVAITRWMRRWLLDLDDAIEDTEFALHRPEDLRCTTTGQVLDLPGERSVFDLNAARVKAWATERQAFQRGATPAELREWVRTLAAMTKPEELPGIIAESLGQVQRDDFQIEKWLLRRPNGIPLPALLLTPTTPADQANTETSAETYLYLDGAGKAAVAEPDRVCLALVKRGHRVLAVDLPGLGETRAEGTSALLGDWKNFYTAYLLGKSLVGIRADAAWQASQWLHAVASSKQGGEAAKTARVTWIARGEAVLPALHAVHVGQYAGPLYLPDGQPVSWAQVVETPSAENQLVGVVHNGLRYYDLPDLVRWHGQVVPSWPTASRDD